LEEGLHEAAGKAGAPVILNRVGTMFTTFFTDHAVTGWETAKASNTKQYGVFFRAMLEGGVYLAPSQFEAGFLSTAHVAQEIEATVAAAEQAFQKVRTH
jgi:glutamate-1-semialdehyde 2,1-aminomutase